MKNKKGFTLIELVLTVALIGLVLQISYSLFFVGSTSYSVSTNKGFSQQEIRLASDMIFSELKYITDLSHEDTFVDEYYSLRIEENGDVKSLVKNKHIYNGDGTEDNKSDVTLTTEIRRLSGNWDSISIMNTSPGIIDIVMDQTETQGFKESGYTLPISIETRNNNKPNSGINIDLMEGDILYYKDTSLSQLSRGIDIVGNTSESEGNTLVTVTFDSDGGSPDTSTVSGYSGSNQDMPENPTKDSYIFDGWYSDLNGNGTYYSGNQILMPNTNITLYAKWIDTIAQVGIQGVEYIDGSSPTVDGTYYKVKKGNDGGSIVSVKLSGYTTGHSGLVSATIAGTSGVIDDDGLLTFAVVPPNGKNKTIDIYITVTTTGYSPISQVFRFIGNL